MIAQFSIWPLDNPHLSKDVAAAAEILDQLEVSYEVNAMGTTVEGDWEEVMAAIHACHQALRSCHTRVLTSITIDDDSTRTLRMREATAKVETRRKEAVTEPIQE